MRTEKKCIDRAVVNKSKFYEEEINEKSGDIISPDTVLCIFVELCKNE